MINRWQSIETAPRDGTWILGGHTGDVRIIRYSDIDGWINVHGNRVVCYPTHWMPLPEPPMKPVTDAEAVGQVKWLTTIFEAAQKGPNCHYPHEAAVRILRRWAEAKKGEKE